MSNVPDYSRGEPRPVHNDGPSMHDLVVSDIIMSLAKNGQSTTKEALIALMVQRKAFGLEKYQTVLQAFNGRVPINDLMDELLDALVYARQDIIEEAENKRDPASLHHAKMAYNRLLTITLDILRERLRRAGLSRDLAGGQYRPVPPIPKQADGQLRDNRSALRVEQSE